MLPVRRIGIIGSVSAIEREDIVTIMVSLMTLHAKADRILLYLGDEDDEEEEA